MRRAPLLSIAVLLALTPVLAARATTTATAPVATSSPEAVAAAPVATVAVATAAPAEAKVAPEIVGLTESVYLTMADLRAMTVTVGMAGVRSSTGAITLPSVWTGASVTDLVALVDGFGPETAVSVEAKCGCAMTLSYD